MKRVKPKEMPIHPDGKPMTFGDIRTLRKAIESFDDIEVIDPSIREVVETHMPDPAERLPPEESPVAQVQRRLKVGAAQKAAAKDWPTQKAARKP